MADGIPFTAFAVDDVAAEVERLRGLGVEVVQDVLDAGPVILAVVADGQGNLLQLAQAKPMPGE